jgi:hypothetical protein
MPGVNYDRLRHIWTFGQFLAFAIAAVVFGGRYSRVEAYLLSGTREGYLGWRVLGATLFWVIYYVFETRRELVLFKAHHIVERATSIGGAAEFTALMVSLRFGFLIGFVTNPITFCILAVGIQFADCIGLWMIQRAFFEVSQEGKGLDAALSDYYFRRPRFVLVGAKTRRFHGRAHTFHACRVSPEV